MTRTAVAGAGPNFTSSINDDDTGRNLLVLRFARYRKSGAVKNLLDRSCRTIHLVKKCRYKETA